MAKNKMNKLFKKLLILIIIFILFYFIYKFLNTNKESFVAATAPVKGYYLMSWKNLPAPEGNWDFGIWFGGESPINAIDNNLNNAYKITSGKKILDLGGGTDTGTWYGKNDFDYINSKLSAIKKAGWDGLCFDVEVCIPAVDFTNLFSDCFAKCKAAGLTVIVTMSHVVPWGCRAGTGQGMDLVNAWIKDPNIDYISPQLYSKDGTTLVTDDLSIFKNVQNKILPSIPYDTDWAKLTTTSPNINIMPAGYLIWNVAAPSTNTSNYCGADWATANKCSGKTCPGGQDSECSGGGQCFSTNCSGSNPAPAPATKHNYCGASWSDAINKCGPPCPSGQDSECSSGGGHCFADVTNCPANK
jgi:hypothetical protein